jgi:ATP-binding cassette subfamily F protein 3
MRMLSGVETPDGGERVEGHQMVMQYFAQDEATRLDPTRNVYQTLAGDAPMHMVPAIRNILGGFLFSGDDVDKPVRVLSGGERTRLAVARMLLRPSNTLLLDEPTNHLDLDSKDVLLEALEDFGGTLIFVSHDRYFVDKLATKVIEIGKGHALIYPGSYEEFLWSRRQAEAPASAAAPAAKSVATKPQPAKPPSAQHLPVQASAGNNGRGPKPHAAPQQTRPAVTPSPDKASAQQSYDDRRRDEAEARRIKKAADTLRKRVDELEARIADRERAIKELEAAMSAPGFYDNREASQPVITKHQALMWEVGDLMNQWESLQTKS